MSHSIEILINSNNKITLVLLYDYEEGLDY